MTVRDLTRETRRDDLKLDVQGIRPVGISCESDGVENEGADGRNWTYAVNGKLATAVSPCTSCKPGDQVLWTFGPQQ